MFFMRYHTHVFFYIKKSTYVHTYLSTTLEIIKREIDIKSIRRRQTANVFHTKSRQFNDSRKLTVESRVRPVPWCLWANNERKSQMGIKMNQT